jgi:nucleoside-diphosphate-sugar epimerase
MRRALVTGAGGFKVHIRHVDGPVGVQSRNFSNGRIESLGWRSRFSLLAGIARTYPWVQQQVAQAAARHAA